MATIECLLTGSHSWGVRADPRQCPKGGYQPVCPVQPELVVLKGQRLACVSAGSFGERGASELESERDGEELRQLPACLLEPLPPQTGSHTICHRAPPAVCHAWPQPQHRTKGFPKKMGGILSPLLHPHLKNLINS